MKNITVLFILIAFIGCSREKQYEKGFSVSPENPSSETDQADGFSKDSVKMVTRPGNVLLTGYPKYRLTPVYKLNYDKRSETYYIEDNNFYWNYSETGSATGNNWNYNFMPGLQAVYGYNIVNVSLYNVETKMKKNIFNAPVLVKTIYFPSYSSDTLNFKPITRAYYMISVYDEDTNKDGFINLKDLRRFYCFDLNGLNRKKLVPLNYSVISSQYDPANDFMYVFAQSDYNNNGQRDESEDIHVFRIDLKNPLDNGRLY
ncbi:MAG: hypothetical protein JXB00_20070 [Bacteroidales bacterium]|nr:hypothetical protein [Bacteroidales bacterium]